ncbi:MAG TPA: sulfurtransferase FdhD, partial [Bacillus bacterium]|nr:sulfurtransferase FdhD [Bacillus sp. (in: firmicutes)]
MLENMSDKHAITKYTDGQFMDVEDVIVNEFPLTIFVNDMEFATMVCTPTHFEEMVVGFLASEGVIRFYSDIHSMSIDEDRGYAYVMLKKANMVTTQEYYSKRFIGSCCGKSRQFYFHNDARTAKTSMAKTTITAAQSIAL